MNILKLPTMQKTASKATLPPEGGNNVRARAKYSLAGACNGSTFLVFLALIFFFVSCRKEPRNPSWDVDVLAPLVKSKLTINNIIADSLLQENPDNSLDIVYKYTLSSFNMDSLFSIPDTTIHNIYPMPITYSVSPGGTIISPISNPIYYALGDAQLTNVTLRGGKMLLSIKSQIKGLVDFTYKMPKVTDAFGNIFDTTVTIPAATSAVDGIYSGEFDLSGYRIDLTGATGTSVNTMITSYSAILGPDNPTGVTIAPPEKVDISNSFTDIVPQYAKGYFGNSVSNVGPDTSEFSMFNHIVDGTLDLEDIDIRLSIQNSIGADARVTISNISSINTSKSNSISLSHAIIGSPLNINRSTDNGGTVAPSTYSVSLTPSNSNIKQFMENLPNRLSYQLDLEVNPLGNVSGGNDFIYYDKLMKTEMNMTIPLSLVANDLTMVDTLDIAMSSITDNVNSGFIFLHADNGFPYTAEAQLYLMDANLNIVDSIISLPNAIEAPALDANYIAVGKELSILAFNLNSERLDHMRASGKILLKVKFNTAGKPAYVKLYSFYEMDVKLVGDFNYTVGK